MDIYTYIYIYIYIYIREASMRFAQASDPGPPGLSHGPWRGPSPGPGGAPPLGPGGAFPKAQPWAPKGLVQLRKNSYVLPPKTLNIVNWIIVT